MFFNRFSLPLTALLCSLFAGDKDEYYIRKHHLPDPAPRGGNLQTHMIKLNVDPPAQRQKPKRVQRAMSQDHVLSPARSKPHRDYGLSSYSSGAAGGLSPYHGRILSKEQLLSADRLHSRDPLLSPDKMLSLRRSDYREKAMSRALSHSDMFVPTTPVMDRHYKMMKMHSHPSSSSNNESYNTLTVDSAQVGNKRQAFANRRMHTVDHLQYIPGHHHHQYRTASKTEVTVWEGERRESEWCQKTIQLEESAMAQFKRFLFLSIPPWPVPASCASFPLHQFRVGLRRI